MQDVRGTTLTPILKLALGSTFSIRENMPSMGTLFVSITTIEGEC